MEKKVSKTQTSLELELNYLEDRIDECSMAEDDFNYSVNCALDELHNISHDIEHVEHHDYDVDLSSSSLESDIDDVNNNLREFRDSKKTVQEALNECLKLERKLKISRKKSKAVWLVKDYIDEWGLEVSR